MAYAINTLGELLYATNDERHVDRRDVAPHVLEMQVWQGMVSLSGGYLPHAHYVARSKANALDWLGEHMEYALDWLGEHMEYASTRKPRGWRRDLAGGYSVRLEGDTYELVSMTVGELF